MATADQAANKGVRSTQAAGLLDLHFVRRWRWPAAFLVAGALLTWIGALLRSKFIAVESNPDALLTIYCATNVDGLRGLTGCFPIVSQPALPPLLRHFFWYPLFGSQTELIHKVPSILYGHLNLVACFLMGLTIFKGRPKQEMLLGASFGAMLAVLCPSEIVSAGDWRDYALISFTSTLFFWSILTNPISPAFVALSGGALINSHFFSVPFVLTVIGFVFFREWFQKRQGNALKLVAIFSLPAVAFAVFSGTVVLGMGTGKAYERPQIGMAWQEGIALLRGMIGLFSNDYLEWLKLPVFGVIMAIRRRNHNVQVVLVALIVVTVEFILIRSKSHYPWANRYYAPFFGLSAAAIMVLAREFMETLNFLSERWNAHSRYRFRYAALALFVVINLLPTSIGDPLSELMRWDSLPPGNHTIVYRDFEMLRRTQKPTLFVLTVQDEHTYPSVYLNTVDGAYTGGFHVARGPFRGDVEEYLKTYPDAQVVLMAGFSTSRAAKLNHEFRNLGLKSRFAGRIRLLQGLNGILIEKVSGKAEVLEVASLLGIPLTASDLAESKSDAGSGFYGYQPLRGRGTRP